jgi:hypothetical protein
MILKPELVRGCLTQERINANGKFVDGIMLHTIKRSGGIAPHIFSFGTRWK